MAVVADLDRTVPLVFRVGLLEERYWDWVNRPENGQPRFFENSVAEHLTKTPWWVVPMIWTPFYVWCLVKAFCEYQVALPMLLSDALFGVLLWQAFEYVVHRFLFHSRCTSYWGITIHFLFHGNHHKYPMDKERLVFPPFPAAFVMAAVYFILLSGLAAKHRLAVFGGMGLGYILYDCCHYACHHSRQTVPFFEYLRSRHLEHHYRDHDNVYGISSTVFDAIMGTDKK